MTTTATRTIRIIVDSSNSERNINQINNRLNQTTQTTTRATFATNKLAAAIGSVVSAYASLNAVKAIANLGDDYAKITGLLRNATSTQEEFNAALALSKQVAESTRASLSGTVDTFAMLERSTRGSGRSTAELFGIIETINKSIALTSPAAESAAAALTQFGQALGTDFKNGSQELNSILEQAPGLAESMAAGLRIPVAELKTMAEQGELTRDRVLNALQSMSKDVDEKFGKIPKTVSSTLQLIKNDLLVTFGDNEVAAPLVNSLEELRDTLNDPAVKDGLVSLSSGLITFVGWMAKAAAYTADFAKSLGYYAAAASGQVSELDRLQKKLEDAKSQSDSIFSGEASKKAGRDAMLFYQAKIDAITNGTKGVIEAIAPSISSPEIAATTTPSLSGSTPALVFEEDERALRESKARQLEIIKAHDKEVESWQDKMAFGERAISSAKETTESLKLELQTRSQVAQFYRDAESAGIEGSYAREIALENAAMLEKKALNDQRYTEDQITRIERRDAALLELAGEEEAQAQVREAYRLQDEAALALHLQAKEDIEAASAERLSRLKKIKADADYQMAIGLGEQIMSAMQGQSKRGFEFAKKAALASAGIDGVKSAISAWRSGMETSGPWAPLVAAGYTAASLLKTNSLIGKIRGASFGGGSVSASAGGSLGSIGGGSSDLSTASTQPAFQQKTVVEITGAIDGNSLVKISDLPKIMGNDNMVVVIAGAQADAQRRGVI